MKIFGSWSVVRKPKDLSTGTVFGRVADIRGQKIERDLFCGEIQRDNKAVAEEKERWVDIPAMTDFGEAYIRRAITEAPESYVKDQIRYEFEISGVLYHPEKIGRMFRGCSGMLHLLQKTI